eukprot:6485169-Amphidinium_carterae.1
MQSTARRRSHSPCQVVSSPRVCLTTATVQVTTTFTAHGSLGSMDDTSEVDWRAVASGPNMGYRCRLNTDAKDGKAAEGLWM